MNTNLRSKSGFTLIELLVVIAIIGILASVVLASLNNARVAARDAARHAYMNQVKIALEMYKNLNGTYPSLSSCRNFSDSELNSLLTPYISLESNSPPVSNDYRYCRRTINGVTAAGYRIRIQFENVNTPGTGSTGMCQFGFGDLVNWGDTPECTIL